jgi:DNA topoisomerase-1
LSSSSHLPKRYHQPIPWRDYRTRIDWSYSRSARAPDGRDIENDFEPRYVISPKKKKVVQELKADALNSAEVFLATDPDREGEAISWHLVRALDSALRSKPIRRVEFHEITRDAIDRAFAKPRDINQQLVDAQQAPSA